MEENLKLTGKKQITAPKDRMKMDRIVMLDRKQLARYLDVSIRTVGRWRRNKKLPKPIIDEPSKPFWSRVQIDEWLMGSSRAEGQSGTTPQRNA